MYNIGLCICGSFCTFDKILKVLKKLVDGGHKVTVILSFAAAYDDTRFYKAEDFKAELKKITGQEPICSLQLAEPFGPKSNIDFMVVAPATGNTISKIASGITDTPVTMAVKAHLRNEKPVLIAVSTNDALGANAINIAKLLNKKNVYFVPFKQDDYINKPTSLISDYDLIEKTIESAKIGKQVQPIIL